MNPVEAVANQFQSLSAHQGAMSLIATAVAPVVMISATAILLGGVGTKHLQLAERVRRLTEEFRDQNTNVRRRTSIREQIPIFLHRLRLVEVANLGLYLANACFIAMVMTIGASAIVNPDWQVASVVFFLLGVVLLFGSVIMLARELHLSNKTMSIEIRDTLLDETGPDDQAH